MFQIPSPVSTGLYSLWLNKVLLSGDLMDERIWLLFRLNHDKPVGLLYHLLLHR